MDLNKYLFNYSIDTDQVRLAIISHFSEYLSYDKSRYIIDVDIHYGLAEDSQSDYALIDISINQQKCMGVIVA